MIIIKNELTEQFNDISNKYSLIKSFINKS